MKNSYRFVSLLLIALCVTPLFSSNQPRKREKPPIEKNHNEQQRRYEYLETGVGVKEGVQKGLTTYVIAFPSISPLYRFMDLEFQTKEELDYFLKNKYQLPSELLPRFTYEELYKFCISKPSNEYYEKLVDKDFSEFNGYQELMSRPDVIPNLLSVYQSYKDNHDCRNQVILLSFIANKNHYYKILSDNDRRFIIKEFYNTIVFERDYYTNYHNRALPSYPEYNFHEVYEYIADFVNYYIAPNEQFYPLPYTSNYINKSYSKLLKYLKD